MGVQKKLTSLFKKSKPHKKLQIAGRALSGSAGQATPKKDSLRMA